jgi:hypothetical protein
VIICISPPDDDSTGLKLVVEEFYQSRLKTDVVRRLLQTFFEVIPEDTTHENSDNLKMDILP